MAPPAGRRRFAFTHHGGDALPAGRWRPSAPALGSVAVTEPDESGSGASTDPPPFDVQMASQLVGKRVLIGLSYVETGQDDRYEQKHGVVEDVSEDGVTICLSDGETYWLPPDLRPWQAAPRGNTGCARLAR